MILKLTILNYKKCDIMLKKFVKICVGLLNVLIIILILNTFKNFKLKLLTHFVLNPENIFTIKISSRK